MPFCHDELPPVHIDFDVPRDVLLSLGERVHGGQQRVCAWLSPRRPHDAQREKPFFIQPDAGGGLDQAHAQLIRGALALKIPVAIVCDDEREALPIFAALMQAKRRAAAGAKGGAA